MNMLIFGAGNIGRGFIGELFAASGFSLVFADVDSRMVDLLNDRKKYRIQHVDGTRNETVTVGPARAIDVRDRNAVICEIQNAALMATAVGVSNLKQLAPALAGGLRARREAGLAPANVLVCENKIGANRMLKEAVLAALPGESHAWLEQNVGFVETSVGRMVPPPIADAVDPLLLRLEPYARLPYDVSCWRGERIDFKGGISCDGFRYQIEKKLFLHNCGHAIAGYLGHQKGYRYVHEAMADGEISGAVREAMEESAAALQALYPEDGADAIHSMEDLLSRFANKGLMDPVTRVCADPLRKLSPDDRLIGALRACERAGIPAPGIQRGIRAALAYDEAGDASAVEMRRRIRKMGEAAFLAEHCGLRGLV